ncbi:MBL fold metallo-hydrolase [Neisseria lisongii]|uniref:MBL fold metallo-hydrolase n=1 Tax=Neisseria lisongii TaxID=2912188 RepID=A0AAW5ABH7_9NEIS|nr:MBL fold metallo-hydrolase [Neisseria lisongii]MCF7529006.1 MBL fold metallo-hydrolase [Neisseria lisongii]
MSLSAKLFRLLKRLFALAAAAALALTAFVCFHPTFGGKPDAQSLAKIQASPNFNGKTFDNLEPTPLNTGNGNRRPNIIAWLYSVTNPPPGKQPAEPLPNLPLDTATLAQGGFAWLGHSTVLMNIDGKTLLTDPVFHRASPVFLGGAPFAMQHTYTAEHMPKLDAVLISHDHYDHLDYRAIQALNAKTEHFYVPLGVKAHLQRWGVADEKISELDWHETAELGGLRFTLAPSRHFSGRNLTNRNSTLWGSWIIRSPQLSVYFNGDSGFGKHFAQNRQRYGRFDIAFMENGAYNENWANIHMTPEQGVQAAQILEAKLVVPIHWGKFDLSYHTWKEPIQRFSATARTAGQAFSTPQIGEVFHLNNPPANPWWESVK